MAERELSELEVRAILSAPIEDRSDMPYSDFVHSFSHKCGLLVQMCGKSERVQSQAPAQEED